MTGQQARNQAFGAGSNIDEGRFLVIKHKFEKYLQMAKDNNMIGICKIDGISRFSQEQAIEVIRRNDIKFGSGASAAYHMIKKHLSVADALRYVESANEIIRDPATVVEMTLAQEGETRTFSFRRVYEENGRRYADTVIVIQTESNMLLLASFTPKMQAR